MKNDSSKTDKLLYALRKWRWSITTIMEDVYFL